ncbi:MAG: Crp/Fnr family transcriptional regulator [Bacteroidetes bacterium]|nr:MAG: Crp/Fnr family transcriptional regulator [Bacteroidota bacterium]
MYPDLDKLFRKFGKLTNDEINDIHKRVQPLKLKRNQYFVEEGKIANHMAFIAKGYLRIYFNHEGEESTRDIPSVNSFTTAFASFITRKPSFEVVRAITDCELFLIHRNDLNELYQKSAVLQQIGRRIMEEMFVRMQKRMYSLLTQNAEDRYRTLLKEKPDFIQNIPLQYIASYLGITSQSLSRLRRNIFIN